MASGWTSCCRHVSFRRSARARCSPPCTTGAASPTRKLLFIKGVVTTHQNTLDQRCLPPCTTGAASGELLQRKGLIAVHLSPLGFNRYCHRSPSVRALIRNKRSQQHPGPAQTPRPRPPPRRLVRAGILPQKRICSQNTSTHFTRGPIFVVTHTSPEAAPVEMPCLRGNTHFIRGYSHSHSTIFVRAEASRIRRSETRCWRTSTCGR